jgi:hypothetical protein
VARSMPTCGEPAVKQLARREATLLDGDGEGAGGAGATLRDIPFQPPDQNGEGAK